MSIRIKNFHSGLYAGIRGASKDAGSQLVQWNRADDGSQVFEVISGVDPGNHSFVAIQNVNSGLFVGVREASSDNGKDLLQWISANDGSQYWLLLDNGNGGFRIQNQHSQKIWSIPNGSTSPGEVVIQWDNDSGNEQLWAFEHV